MVNREKQAEVLRRTQAKRKEQKKEQVLKAIFEIQKQKKPLTFKNIAIVAGCSVSYLYKWDEIKAYIHELQNSKQTTINPIEENSKYQPHSLKTLLLMLYRDDYYNQDPEEAGIMEIIVGKNRNGSTGTYKNHCLLVLAHVKDRYFNSITNNINWIIYFVSAMVMLFSFALNRL